MRHREVTSPVEWAKRVNRSWLVRSNLNEHAEEWISYLEKLDDGRLQTACQTARMLCELRHFDDDPKPWFYAGLFHSATQQEAQRFLSTHRVTKATVPSMKEDPEVHLWWERVGPETHALLERLHEALANLKKG